MRLALPLQHVSLLHSAFALLHLALQLHYLASCHDTTLLHCFAVLNITLPLHNNTPSSYTFALLDLARICLCDTLLFISKLHPAVAAPHFSTYRLCNTLHSFQTIPYTASALPLLTMLNLSMPFLCVTLFYLYSHCLFTSPLNFAKRHPAFAVLHHSAHYSTIPHITPPLRY